jgi:hypothetical protein
MSCRSTEVNCNGISPLWPVAPEVENLLEIIAIKRACCKVGVEKVEAGAEGAVIALRGNRFASSAGLVELIQRNAGTLNRRRPTIASAGQDRPHRQTRGRHGVAAAEPRSGQAAGGEKRLIPDQLTICIEFRNSTTPRKCRSLTVTTTQLFAAAVAAMIISIGLRGRPTAVPAAMVRAHSMAARSSKGRTRPEKSAAGPSVPINHASKFRRRRQKPSRAHRAISQQWSGSR